MTFRVRSPNLQVLSLEVAGLNQALTRTLSRDTPARIPNPESRIPNAAPARHSKSPPVLIYFLLPRPGRDVAQPGSAPEWGSGGREFESRRPDQKTKDLRRQPQPTESRLVRPEVQSRASKCVTRPQWARKVPPTNDSVAGLGPISKGQRGHPWLTNCHPVLPTVDGSYRESDAGAARQATISARPQSKSFIHSYLR